jgi:hypothetical protein
MSCWDVLLKFGEAWEKIPWFGRNMDWRWQGLTTVFASDASTLALLDREDLMVTQWLPAQVCTEVPV